MALESDAEYSIEQRDVTSAWLSEEGLLPLTRHVAPSSCFGAASHGGSCSANVLFVSSYSGKVTTLDLKGIGAPCAGGSVPVLKEIASSDGCSTSPSWLTLDHPKSTLYCIDEGLATPQGSLSSFKTNADGSLTKLDLVSTPNGPVSGVLYGPGGDAGIALAH